MIFCWATFIAILGCTQPAGHRLDTPVRIWTYVYQKAGAPFSSAICKSPKLETTHTSVHSGMDVSVYPSSSKKHLFILPSLLTAVCAVTQIRPLHILVVSSIGLLLKPTCFTTLLPSSPPHCHPSALVPPHRGNRFLNHLPPTACPSAVLLHCSYLTLLKPECDHLNPLLEMQWVFLIYTVKSELSHLTQPTSVCLF